MEAYTYETATREEARRRGCRYAVACTVNDRVLSYHRLAETAEKAIDRLGPGFWGIHDFEYGDTVPVTVYQKMSWEH